VGTSVDSAAGRGLGEEVLSGLRVGDLVPPLVGATGT